MKLRFWQNMMYLAWVINDLSDTFVEMAQQRYYSELLLRKFE